MKILRLLFPTPLCTGAKTGLTLPGVKKPVLDLRGHTRGNRRYNYYITKGPTATERQWEPGTRVRARVGARPGARSRVRLRARARAGSRPVRRR